MNVKMTLFPFIVSLFFNSCATENQNTIIVKQTQKAISYKKVKANLTQPIWTKLDTKIPLNMAVGYARPVFQGMYMQKQNAINDAKIKLSHKINSIVSSKTQQKMVVFNNEVDIKSVQNIKAFSKIALNDLKQYDAYVDKDGGLYILVGIGVNKQKFFIEKKQLKPYSNTKLLKSKCYTKSVLSQIDTKSKVYNERPLWFYEPDNDRYYTSIGIAQQSSRNFQKQKEMAILLGKSNMMKKIRSQSSSEMKLLKLLRNDETTSLYEVSASHKSSAKVNNILVKDIWMDPKTCELYVLVYSSR